MFAHGLYASKLKTNTCSRFPHPLILQVNLWLLCCSSVIYILANSFGFRVTDVCCTSWSETERFYIEVPTEPGSSMDGAGLVTFFLTWATSWWNRQEEQTTKHYDMGYSLFSGFPLSHFFQPGSHCHLPFCNLEWDFWSCLVTNAVEHHWVSSTIFRTFYLTHRHLNWYMWLTWEKWLW